MGEARERSEDVELGDRREERVDHRLDRHIGAIDRATIGPAFEVVRSGHESALGILHERRGFVVSRAMVTEADNLLGGLHGLGEVNVRRSVVGGVTTEDDERGGGLGDEVGNPAGNRSGSLDVADGGTERGVG